VPLVKQFKRAEEVFDSRCRMEILRHVHLPKIGDVDETVILLE
jgi:hypothetical protein